MLMWESVNLAVLHNAVLHIASSGEANWMKRVTVRIDMQCDLIDMDNLDDIHILELKEAFDEFDKV